MQRNKKKEKCEVVDCIHVLLSGVIISEVEQSITTWKRMEQSEEESGTER
jgi:hypothetical protein